MAFDVGFNFRATLGFVTDPAGTASDLGATYPRAVTVNGSNVTVGWNTDATGSGRDRTTTPPTQLSGINFSSTAQTWRIDLPEVGPYSIYLGVGDPSGNALACDVLNTDGTSVLFSVSNAFVSGQFLDALGTLHSSPANWLANQQPRTISPSGQTIYIRLPGPSNNPIAHVRVASQAPVIPPPPHPPLRRMLGAGATGRASSRGRGRGRGSNRLASLLVNRTSGLFVQSLADDLYLDAPAAGGSPIVGQSNVVLAVLLANATGTLSDPQVTGSAAAVLGELQALAQSRIFLSGQQSAQLGVLLTTAGAGVSIAGNTAGLLAQVTQSSQGKIAIAGAASVSLGVLLSNATGTLSTPQVNGVVAVNLGAIQSAAQAALLLRGQQSAQLGVLLSAGDGDVNTLGVGGGQLASLGGAATSRLALSGVMSGQLGELVSGGVAALRITAQQSQTLGLLVGASVGGSAFAPIAGQAAQVLGPLLGNAQATLTIRANGVIVLGVLQGSGAAGLDVGAVGGGQLAALESLASGQLDIQAEAGALLGLLQSEATGEISFPISATQNTVLQTLTVLAFGMVGSSLSLGNYRASRYNNVFGDTRPSQPGDTRNLVPSTRKEVNGQDCSSCSG